MYKREFSKLLGSIDTFVIRYKKYHAYPFEGSRTHWGHMSLPPPPVNHNQWGIQARVSLDNAVQNMWPPNSLNHFNFPVSGTWPSTVVSIRIRFHQ